MRLCGNRLSSYYSKEDEFRAWLQDIKHISPEVLSNRDQKEYFSEFAEDFNTVTLPSEKYYNLAKYEADELSQSMSQKSKSRQVVDLSKDEENMKMERKHDRVTTSISGSGSSGGKPLISNSVEPTMTRTQLLELKRVTEERIHAEKLRIMRVPTKKSMGTRYETK